MKIGVIGTINRDTIKFLDGTTKKSWGGVLYNLAAFSYLLGGRVEIFPVCNIGADCYLPIMQMLKRLPGVRLDYLKKVPENNNHCFLTYLDAENKREILKGGVRRLKFDDIKPLRECNIILVNYLSGRDVYLNSLRKLRRLYDGPIYIDIHSLTLGKRSDGTRFLRHPSNWAGVAEVGDFIQVNRLELSILTKNEIPITKRDIVEQSGDFFRYLADNDIGYAKKCLIITDGSHGCHMFYRKQSRICHIHIPVQRIVKKGDTTGCGDCFSAGFIAGLIADKGFPDCAREGNRAAYLRIKGCFESLHNL